MDTIAATILAIVVVIVVAGGALLAIRVNVTNGRKNTNKVSMKNVDAQGDVTGRDKTDVR